MLKVQHKMHQAMSSPSMRFQEEPVGWTKQEAKFEELPFAEEVVSTVAGSDSEDAPELVDHDDLLEEELAQLQGESPITVDVEETAEEDRKLDVEEAEQCTPQASTAKDPAKREVILRQIVSSLQEQVAEA